MLLELNKYNTLLRQLRHIALTIDEDLSIYYINEKSIVLYRFSKGSKYIYATYNSIRFSKHEDIINQAINMISKKSLD